MKLILKRMSLFIGLIALSLTLGGWSLLGPSSKAKPLTDEIIKENKGDFQGLWTAWIKPQLTPWEAGYWGLKFYQEEARQPTEESIEKDFSRFCTESGGISVTEKTKYKNDFLCSSPLGEFMGVFHTQYHWHQKEYMLAISVETPKTKAKQAESQNKFDASLKSNGPSGWVTTSKGRYQFIRIGTLKERDKIEVKNVPIEEIRSIDFIEPCCDIQIMQTSGMSFKTNKVDYRKRTAPNSNTNFGLNGLSFVLVDSATGLTYQEVFEGRARSDQDRDYRLNEKVKKIELDDLPTWQEKLGGQLLDGGEYLKLTSGSLSIDEMKRLILKFENRDPNNLVPKAKTRLISMIDDANSQQVIKARQQSIEDRQQSQAAEEHRNRLENKQVSDQVCLNTKSTVKKPTGYIIMGEPQYRSVEGEARIVGFVENVNQVAKKIQIRISGINFSGGGISESLDSFSNFKGGSKLLLNSVIWDSTYDWESCSY